MARKAEVDPDGVRALLNRVFGMSVPVDFHRTPDGISTQVYRIYRGSEIFYLRVAEQADENLELDAQLHRRLRSLGVKVADVVHVEPFNADIGRSTLITTEVPGVPLAEVSDPVVAATVLEQAGADLAIVNQIPVHGFGFVRRRGSDWPPDAEYPGYEAFLFSFLPRPWPGPLADLFDGAQLDYLEGLIEHERALPHTSAVLQHGDFDLTQVFCHDGKYTGLIDFGEIRGAEPLFDLGHFQLYDQGTPVNPLLPALLHGYQQVLGLQPDHLDCIRRSAILLGLRQLCRWFGPPINHPLDSQPVIRRVQRLNELIKP